MIEFLGKINASNAEGTLPGKKHEISDIAKEEFCDCFRGDVKIDITSHRCDSEINTFTAELVNILVTKGRYEFSGIFYLM